jgi:hypothetical protein
MLWWHVLVICRWFTSSMLISLLLLLIIILLRGVDSCFFHLRIRCGFNVRLRILVQRAIVYFYLLKRSKKRGADPVPEAPTRVGSREGNNRSKVLPPQKFCRDGFEPRPALHLLKRSMGQKYSKPWFYRAIIYFYWKQVWTKNIQNPDFLAFSMYRP